MEIAFDWSEEHSKSMLSKMQQLRSDHYFCDIKISVGSNIILAHKIVLVSAIPYFHSMFTHDVAERQQDLVTLKNMDASAVDAIINFAYTSKIIVNQENVQTLLQVATILQINMVQKSCCRFLEDQLDPSNCLGIYSFAELHGCLDLKVAARNYCDRHFTKVAKHEEYMLLPLDRVLWLLAHNELCVRSEIEVFNAAMAWVEFDAAARRDSLPQLLKLVRLHCIPKNLLHNVSQTNDFVLSDQHSLHLIEETLKDLDLGVIPSAVRMPLGAQVIYCVGGYQKQSLTAFEYYHPDSEKWCNLPPLNKPKSGCGAVFVGGYLYLVGGRTNSAYGNTDSDTVERYDPFNGEWAQVASLTVPRNRLGVGVIDGHIYAVGGNDGMIHLNSVERYNADENAWTYVTAMNTRRIGVGVAAMDRILYAVGGFDSENRLRSVECYLPDTNQWKQLAAMNTPRSGAGVIALNGYIYAVGGYNGVAQLNSAERYCPKDDRWTMIVPMNQHRSALSVAVARNKLFAVGGYDGEKFLCSVEVYYPDSGEWQLIASLPVGRSGAGLTVGTMPLT